MKQPVTLALASTLMLTTLVGCTAGAAQTSGADTPSLADAKPTAAQTAENFSNEMKIEHAVDLSPEDGADSVERAGDHEDSPYFKHPDFYNMESTDTLTILPKFKTIQQTSEWSCGVDSALMVMNWYGTLGDYNEETLAKFRSNELTPEATSLQQLIEVFEGVGGYDLYSTLDCENPAEEFTLEFIQETLAKNTPIMVGWNDWGGHWQTIIGYDTMGTETQQDDVFIVADPYDTTDHCQDGYGVLMAERFLYNFSMYGAFPEEEGGSDFLFLVASPAE